MDPVVVCADWGNRQFVETMEFNLLSIAEFLNNFENASRTKLARLNTKLRKLERYIDFIEATVRDVAEDEGKQVTDLQVQTLNPGDGENQPRDGNRLTITYKAYLPDGSLLEEFSPDAPLQFILGSGVVIPGLEFTLKNMTLGEQARAIVPSHLAYGEQGVQGRVPSNAALIYDVFLAAIE